ncbi:DUF411 domain-containing protein [Arcobacter porcinus]|uniref:DUF411 domain-containing protein n=1 Tax=Arcobacter porcinus TaxID=1935204 RepID=UPI00081DE98B|nr:DUF411 domain-containing protein [Arcobacter porcinus]OCL83678.1 hypothetical protein AAW30_00920 [Arcobacter porcinus]OCL83897.1 hypothetical protein AAW29_00732 [Arcobacter porcinus]OCL85835.1 hypothetical protein AAX30_01661 [Arcobacter porcinus]
MKKTIFSLILLSNFIFAMQNKTMTVFKSPYCGCCTEWIDIMKKEGFNIKTINTNDVNTIKQKAGLQAGQASCHTAFVDGYVVEGHVNYSAIKKMLEEKPDIIGLTVPGMPIGSPGMEQDNIKEPYDILFINKDGTTGVYESHK